MPEPRGAVTSLFLGLGLNALAFVLYLPANIAGTFNVLEAARVAKVGRLMFAASSAAYGDSDVLPKVETMPSLPQCPYAANKVAGEAIVRAGPRGWWRRGASRRDGNGRELQP
jgi:nucleoside-diphosphate-sugar epimerase